MHIVLLKRLAQSTFLKNANESAFKSVLNQFHSGCRVIISNPKLLSTVATITLMSVFFRGSFPMYQPYMKAVDIDVTWFGWIFFAFNIIAAPILKTCSSLYGLD